MNKARSDEYSPLFELGIYDENPAVRTIGEFTICPVSLAALVTALFETVMQAVPENEQIEFEKKFIDSFAVLIQERFEYDISYKFLYEDE